MTTTARPNQAADSTVLDSAYFHLYGAERDDVLGAFRAFRNPAPNMLRPDRAAILERYDAIGAVINRAVPHRHLLDPLPGDGARHEHPTDR